MGLQGVLVRDYMTALLEKLSHNVSHATKAPHPQVLNVSPSAPLMVSSSKMARIVQQVEAMFAKEMTEPEGQRIWQFGPEAWVY